MVNNPPARRALGHNRIQPAKALYDGWPIPSLRFSIPTSPEVAMEGIA